MSSLPRDRAPHRHRQETHGPLRLSDGMSGTLYDQLFEIHGFTTHIKRFIFCNIFLHVVAVFKNEAREFRVHHMTHLLEVLADSYYMSDRLTGTTLL